MRILSTLLCIHRCIHRPTFYCTVATAASLFGNLQMTGSGTEILQFCIRVEAINEKNSARTGLIKDKCIKALLFLIISVCHV